MGNPSIHVNTYNNSASGHTNVTFYDENGVKVGTWDGNLGPTSLPGSLGGVYEESSRPGSPSYVRVIEFDSSTANRWNNALFYAQESARMTAGGAGEYFFIGFNCYDFVDSVLVQASFTNNSAYQFMDPSSLGSKPNQRLEGVRLS